MNLYVKPLSIAAFSLPRIVWRLFAPLQFGGGSRISAGKGLHRSLAILILLCLMFFPGPAVAEDQPNKNATATVGGVEVELKAPAGFQRVDGLDYDVDRRLAIFHPETSDVLAIFAEPDRWKPFFAEIFGTSPRDLSFYATITTAPATNEFETITLDLADIKDLLKINEIDSENDAASLQLEIGQPAIAPLEQIARKARFTTFKCRIMEAVKGDQGAAKLQNRYFAVISAIEVDGQMLFLNLFSNRRGPKEADVLSLAEAWRDEYLANPKPTLGETSEN